MSNREKIFDHLAIAEIVTQRGDWKQALDEVLAVVYSIFIFDHLALFLSEQESSTLTEIVYARAVGRGRTAGAEVSWGGDIANQVMERKDIVVQEPPKSVSKDDRLNQAYLLGLPLRTSTGLYGALVFVRFGGPVYTDEHILQARYIASQFAGLFERKKLNEDIQALNEARRLLAVQDDFIATISHELRTPLGFIKGYSTTLLREDTEWDETSRREFLTIIDEEADHLTTLLGNVLDASRLQSNSLPMKFQPVRLDTLLVEIGSRAQARTKGLRIDFDFQIRPIVKADSVRMGEVLSNLFTNAAKYAPESPISISISAIPGYYRIRFADSGPGVKPEYVSHLLERFFRVPGQAGGGSGLGLFICNKIVDAHGGRMSVESEYGKGTAFLIDLPLDPVVNPEGDKHGY